MQAVTRGGTQWRRTGLLLIPALFVMGVLTIMTLQGGLPVRLAISGQDFKLSSNGAPVSAPQGAGIYPSTIEMKDGTNVAVLRAGLPEAILSKGLCLSLVLTFPIIGTNTLQVNTSRETTIEDMKAAALSLDSKDAALGAATSDGKEPNPDGSNVKAGVQINKDASELSGLAGGAPGAMGVDAPGMIRLNDLKASAAGATISGTAKLGGLGIPKLGHGRGTDNGECY